MKLIFVRHGQTDLNKQNIIQGRSDWPLNETGINDAIRSSEVLVKAIDNVDVFISSPSQRAVQTTEIIKDKFGFNGDIITDEHFYERNFGAFDGKYVADVFPITSYPPNYENDDEIQKRVSTGVKKLHNTYQGKTVLVGCHSHTIKAILTQIIPNYSWRAPLENGAAFVFKVTNDKITLLKELK